jgi:hypothetical protein
MRQQPKENHDFITIFGAIIISRFFLAKKMILGEL